MPHWRSMMDRDKLHACDLGGQDRIVTIEKVEQGEVQNGSKKSKKPHIWFKGQPKPLALNVTNATAITRIAGTPETEQWVGKRIILYPTVTEMNGEQKECIRVRPNAPPEPKRSAKDEEPQS